jgi:hypothetical protein
MKLKKGVILQKLGDTFVAYDNEESVMHEVNEVGFSILSGIEKGGKKEQIVINIVESFKVGKKEAKKDLEDFLQVLKKKNLL